MNTYGGRQGASQLKGKRFSPSDIAEKDSYSNITRDDSHSNTIGTPISLAAILTPGEDSHSNIVRTNSHSSDITKNGLDSAKDITRVAKARVDAISR